MTGDQSNALTVRVPATSANLGPGFDILGLALTLYNTFTVRPASATRVTTEGYGVGLPTGESNLFYRAFRHLFSLSSQTAPALDVQMQLDVPPGKGLGSSATAVVGGLVAANTWLEGRYSPEQLLREAIKLEHGGHADNVAPALLGGLVVNVMSGGAVVSLRLDWPADLRAVLFTPDFPMDTIQGRALMPSVYSKEDTIFNASRVALFMSALLTRRYDLLYTAMQDRIHQPYRTQLFPLLPALIEAACVAGAHGACLSGGGSSVLAIVTGDVEKVAHAMAETALAGSVPGDIRVLDVDTAGAAVQHEYEGTKDDSLFRL